MQIKRIILVVILVTLTLSVSSCYDSTEVDDMAYVLAIGIDETDEQDKLYTFQVAIPLNISGGVETGFAESEDKTTVQNISINANDLFSALETANIKLAKELSVSHCKILLFSQNSNSALLKNNVINVNNYAEFSPDTQIAFCENKAADYLDNISSPFEKNPARYYDIFFNKKFTLQAFSTKISDFEKHKTLALPLYTESNATKTLIVNNYENISILSQNETFALNSITGKLNTGYYTIDGITAIIHKAHSPKIQVKIKNSAATFNIKLNFEGKIFKENSSEKTNKENIEQHIKNQCLSLLKVSTEQNIDIADLIKFSKPKFFTTKSYDNFNWENNYKNSQFNVTVNFKEVT